MADLEGNLPALLKIDDMLSKSASGANLTGDSAHELDSDCLKRAPDMGFMNLRLCAPS